MTSSDKDARQIEDEPDTDVCLVMTLLFWLLKQKSPLQ